MTYKRAALFLFGGSLLLLTPFLMNLSEGVEKSIFSAMATLTDVKETLDDRLIKMSDLYLSLDSTPQVEQAQKVAEAKKHYAYAEDVHKLATDFISASSKRYPRYSTFWERYSKRLQSTWNEIETVEKQLIAFAPDAAGKKVVVAKAATKKAVSPGSSQMISPAVKEVAKTPRPVKIAKAAPKKVVSPVKSSKPTVTRTSLNKKDVLVTYREGYQFYAQGGPENLTKAVKSFSEILDIQPAFHLARYWLAKAYLLQNEVVLADVEAAKLLKAQPNLQIAKDLSKEVKTVARLKGIKSTKPMAVAKKPVVNKAVSAPVRQTPARRTPVKIHPVQAAKAQTPAPVRIIKNEKPVAAKVNPTNRIKATKEDDLDEATRAMLARVNRRVGIPAKKTYVPSTVSRRQIAKAPVAKTPVVKAPVRRVQVAKAPVKRTSSYSYAGPLAPSTDSDHRPIACMIENSKRARPQSGLSMADIVYEMPVEGGITRFMAIFLDPKKTEVAKIGPVRSARHYFVQQVPAFDALYAHCGSSTMGYAELKKLNIDDIDEIRYGHGFFRDKTRKAPHNLYTSMNGLTKAFSRKGFSTAKRRNPTFMSVYKNAAPGQTSEIVDLALKYHRKYNVAYKYSPVNRQYERYMNGEKHCEADSEKQIKADNVLVVSVKTRVMDKYGRLDMDLVSGGEAVLHRSGEIIEGQWKRDSIYGGIRFNDNSGKKCPLNPGKTWVQFINQRSTMTVAKRPLNGSDQIVAKRLAANTGGAIAVSRKAVTAAPVVNKPVATRKVNTFASRNVIAASKPTTFSRAYPSNPVRVAPTPDMYPDVTRAASSSANKTATATRGKMKESTEVFGAGEIDVIDFELDAF